MARYGGMPPPNNNGYGGLSIPGQEYDDDYSQGYGGQRPMVPAQSPLRSPPASNTMHNVPSRSRMRSETNAERQITQVLEHIHTEWPSMYEGDVAPVQLALQLLDTSSVGRAHEYAKFQQTHSYLQDSLKGIVHEHHQGFNSSIGTFHKIQTSIQVSQKRVRALKESLVTSKVTLSTTDPELLKLSKTSQTYDELIQTLNELDELRSVPDQLEARISEKRFLTAVEVLHNALRKLRKPELDDIGALSDLRNYLSNQETSLMDTLVEELHEHLYLKSPYCQDRWQNLAKTHQDGYSDVTTIVPFHAALDSLEIDKSATEDPMKNPEADTFYYVTLIVEALNKLGRLQNAVETLKHRMPVELFGIVTETINEVDQRHPSSLRGSSSKQDGLHVYGARETRLRADVIYDLLWTLYGKFEAISEGQRVFHESIKALIRREGAGNNSILLGSFKELWNLYQNEIRSLLHNYVTTDADVYQFDSPSHGASNTGRKDGSRENLFKFSEVDPKSDGMTVEYEALEGIIQATVPGLTSGTRKNQDSNKKSRQLLDEGTNPRRGTGYGNNSQQQPGSYRSLVEPSVFNMSLLLPPTLVFLQRLKGVVPPGSDLATSTLTTFLDNFLVNVFQPQLDETLGKLSDTVFGELDSFSQDPAWSQVARRPVFKGTTAFFEVVTAFCRMLGTIPPDQALSSLIVTQMMRYYDRCFSWFKSLVTQTQDDASDDAKLRASARLAIDPGDIRDTMQQIWESEEDDKDLAQKEISLLINQTNNTRLLMSDIIQDHDTLSALCLLYTSMKWLAGKISGLRHITNHETDSSRQNISRQSGRRWTLMNDPNRATSAQGPVQLPLTQDTAQAFDSIVSSFEELAGTALLTLHMEARCRIVHSLRIAMSPDVAPYLLDQDVTAPDPQILSLNSELVVFDEIIERYLRDSEIKFIRTGLGLLINSYLVGNAKMVSPMNAKGSARMQLNILVLQQNLKNIEDAVDLARSSNYYTLFDRGADEVAQRAKEAKSAGIRADPYSASIFSFEELRALIELCFSEQLAHPERGMASMAKRKLDEKLQELNG
ncbi:unnamed protein product [Clonostachys rosea]|uniref:Exocyst complex component Sec8 n=1 Tax=Bionectria ochroleuca TaxID=29856 RepID=A0ABY6TUV2_BIOOC|nr:unnamed protein product [Clonostachys rosea]